MKYLKSIKGITLIEIMVVVVIIGIMSSMAAPKFGKAVERIEFKSKAKGVVSMLRLARSEAITKKTPHGVFFDYINFQYILFEDLNDPTSHTYDDGLDSIVRVDTLSGAYPYVYSTFTTASVVFQPNGSANESGMIYIGVYSDRNASHCDLSVLASTGRVKMQNLRNY